MSDLRAVLDKRYEGLAAAISATVGDWLGHDTPSSPHGWRCEDKTRYPGPCGCDGEMADEVMAVLGDLLPELLAQAWGEGADFVARHPDMSAEYVRAANPYRQESGRG